MGKNRRMNITLIGMPGSGKSTAGRALAKRLGMAFEDVDAHIEEARGQRLEEIIRETGPDGFLALETAAVLALACENTVIAPGGSAVYSEAAMAHLRALGPVVYLEVPYAELEHRLGNLAHRGVIIAEGQSLRDLFLQRTPLYERESTLQVACDHLTLEPLLDRIEELLAAERV
jgi:shikimate kinase